jgi:hypothetical protein
MGPGAPERVETNGFGPLKVQIRLGQAADGLMIGRRRAVKSRRPQHVEVVDSARPVLRCRRCGTTWTSNVLPGGRLPKGSWQCPRGC